MRKVKGIKNIKNIKGSNGAWVGKVVCRGCGFEQVAVIISPPWVGGCRGKCKCVHGVECRWCHSHRSLPVGVSEVKVKVVDF